MRDAIKIALILVFIFSFWFQPSSPFLVKWLTQSKNFTPEQVYEELFPLWSYSQFTLIIGGLFAQFVSFRALFAIGAFLNLVSNALLIWGDTLWWMRGSEIANGAAVGTFGILIAYAYTVFPEEMHQKITSFTRATTLIATTASASTGQIITDSTRTVFVALWVSVATGIITCFVSFFLPPPLPSQQKYQEGDKERQIQDDPSDVHNNAILTSDTEKEANEEGARTIYSSSSSPSLLSSSSSISPPSSSSPSSCSSMFRKHWRLFLANYNPSLLIWTGWSGACFAIHMLVLTYWQSVMNQIDPSVNWNGYVSTVAYALAAALALIPTKMENFLNKYSEWMLIIMPLFFGTCLLLLSRETVIYLAYMWLIAYHALFEFSFAVSSVQVARNTGKPKQFGIVFSLNVLVALVIQNITQLIVGKQALNLTPTAQYAVYAYIFFGISVACLIWLLWLKLATRKQNAVVVETVEKHPLI